MCLSELIFLQQRRNSSREVPGRQTLRKHQVASAGDQVLPRVDQVGLW